MLELLFVLIVSMAIAFQIGYNRIVSEKVDSLGSFQLGMLIRLAIEDQIENKSLPDTQQRIPEVRLKLTAPSTDIGQVLYTYNEEIAPDPGNDIPDTPAFLQITTKAIAEDAISQVPLGGDTDTIFERVPQVQACSRGFKVQFRIVEGDTNADRTKILKDGRTMYLWREAECVGSFADTAYRALEEYLMTADSY